MSYFVDAVFAPSRSKTGFFTKILKANALYAQRQSLRCLDADRLADLGLNATDVDRELAQPIWNAPTHWRS